MIVLFVIVILILALFVSSAYQQNKQKRKALALIREYWAKPKPENFNFKQIAAYYNHQPSTLLAEALANDVDIEKLFEYIDRTNSKPGQQYLYAKLHTPQRDLEKLLNFDRLVDEVNQDHKKRESISEALQTLNNSNAYYLHQLFHYEIKLAYPAIIRLYIQVSGILWIAILAGMIAIHNQMLFLALLGLTIFNFYLHYKNKGKIAGFIHSLPQLKTLIKISGNIGKLIQTHDYTEAQQSVSNLSPLQRKLGFLNIESSINNDPTDIGFAVWELIKTVFLIESRTFINAVDMLNKHRDDISVLYHYIAGLDVAISVQSLRESLPYYSKPNFTTTYTDMKIADLYHPLIANCVPNSLVVKAHQGVLITGSNMSGKTTFIRSLAINTLLSQTLFTSTAHTYQAPLLDICTSINMADSLEESKSYFQAEALSIFNIINHSKTLNGNCMIFIDEIFRGTNTIERVAAAQAILSHLTSFPNFVFVSTHDLELAELLGNEYAVYSFEEMAADERLVFDYKIKPGILKHKNAIAVLKAFGYPDEVITQAYQVSEALGKKYS